MPSTRSSAATKCISEVPGLAKHTLTPPPTRVRTRLSAPFIALSPLGGGTRTSCRPAPDGASTPRRQRPAQMRVGNWITRTSPPISGAAYPSMEGLDDDEYLLDLALSRGASAARPDRSVATASLGDRCTWAGAGDAVPLRPQQRDRPCSR